MARWNPSMRAARDNPLSKQPKRISSPKLSRTDSAEARWMASKPRRECLWFSLFDLILLRLNFSGLLGYLSCLGYRRSPDLPIVIPATSLGGDPAWDKASAGSPTKALGDDRLGDVKTIMRPLIVEKKSDFSPIQRIRSLTEKFSHWLFLLDSVSKFY